MLSRISTLLIILFGVSIQTFSQYTEQQDVIKRNWTDKVFFGGNFGIMIGNPTQIVLSPTVGYKITKRFSAGLGFSYQYYHEKFYYHISASNIDTFTYNSSIYGPKIFGTFVLIPDISEYLPLAGFSLLSHIENEVLNTGSYEKTPSPFGYVYNDGNRRWINNLLVGGGISQKIGSRSSINLMILYNLTQAKLPVYPDPLIIRIGLNF